MELITNFLKNTQNELLLYVICLVLGCVVFFFFAKVRTETSAALKTLEVVKLVLRDKLGDKAEGILDIWIEGLKKVNTYWVTILHDDDIILPTVKDVVSCLDERCLFGVWNGCVENIANKKIELEKTIDLNLKSGIYRCALIKDQIIRYPHVISPIHGIFPTNKLIDCLTEWEKTHGKDDFFYEKSYS